LISALSEGTTAPLARVIRVGALATAPEYGTDDAPIADEAPAVDGAPEVYVAEEAPLGTMAPLGRAT